MIRIRRDGNCFYRAFLYSLFESMQTNETLKSKIQNKINNLDDFFKNAGYEAIVIEDF